ncbi:NTPase KAP family P-loop domain-containing protein 1-like [Protopterus annectens]|uniref:NTPase KAP family P-loop domain-containing protein 1-like n=1 Tax=Protopterus annectens TaxID=7888 RepID=UPI001CFB7269|nr:NTPase KAP family P-loop domain-containing protein 1-like [Protopterus annectens]
MIIPQKNDEEKSKPRRAKCGNKFLLLLCMLFCTPALTDEQRRRENTRFIFIPFSAWQYAGSDILWAGLITTIFDAIKHEFGALPICVYRATLKKCKIMKTESEKEWIAAKFGYIPYWIILIFFILLIIGIVIFFIFGFPTGGLNDDVIAIPVSIGIVLPALPALKVFLNIMAVVKNFIITQRVKVENMMNKTSVSSRLGFMHDVKNEVEVVTNFIHYMEIFERTKIRVVLQITDLDKCAPDKIAGVLDALTILLSDKDGPFISILAVDPSIIADCLERSKCLAGTDDNGYVFLNRTVTLLFSVPQMDDETKMHFLQKIACPTNDEKKDIKRSTSKDKLDQDDSINGNEVRIPLLNNRRSDRNPKCLTKTQWGSVFDDKLRKFIIDNVTQIKRITNSFFITFNLIKAKMEDFGVLLIKEESNVKLSEEKITELNKLAAWVVLANQWPCRLSWILQYTEDEQQKLELTEATEEKKNEYKQESLLSVFEKSLDELQVIKSDIEKLFKLDYDPELFQLFLSDKYFKFTVEDANKYFKYTINLDRSLKRNMELLCGINNIKYSRTSMKTAPIPLREIINMTSEDVSNKMGELDGFSDKHLGIYQKKILEHNLNGKALVYTHDMDIKEALEMTLGDWTTFRIYFPAVEALPSINENSRKH